jgi:hypothetical protein
MASRISSIVRPGIATVGAAAATGAVGATVDDII